MGGLDGYGLAAVTWEAADEPLAGRLVASPADAEGRGMALSVSRDGEAVDLTGSSVYLLWRHRATRARGCEPFQAVDASAGSFRVFWPAAMAAHEGTADAQVMVALPDGSSIGSRTFTVGVEQELLAGPGEGGEDGFSLFLEAIAKYEAAEALSAEAAAAANEAASAAEAAAAEVRAASERGDFDGADGAPGADGASPAAAVAQTEAGAVVTVTDASGTTTATLLHGAKGDPGEPGEKGDAFFYEDFTEAQLEALRGPQGPAGADGADAGPSLHCTSEVLAVSNATQHLDFAAGTAKVGDFVLDRYGTIYEVTGIDAGAGDGGRDDLSLLLVHDTRARRIGTVEDVDLAPGEESAGFVDVEGQLLREGDWALCPETGCLAEIVDEGVKYVNELSCRIEGLCQLATRGYVDAAIAALDDLSEEEF